MNEIYDNPDTFNSSEQGEFTTKENGRKNKKQKKKEDKKQEESWN